MRKEFINTRLRLQNRHIRPKLTIPQTYSEEKGFTFIARCFDATEIFGHKREFPPDVVPYVGQPVSFLYEVTEKGDTAKKVLSHMQEACTWLMM